MLLWVKLALKLRPALGQCLQILSLAWFGTLKSCLFEWFGLGAVLLLSVHGYAALL